MKDIQKKSNDFGHNFIQRITKELEQLDKELNKNMKPPNKIIKKFKNFKYIVSMIENFIVLFKKELL